MDWSYGGMYLPIKDSTTIIPLGVMFTLLFVNQAVSISVALLALNTVFFDPSLRESTISYSFVFSVRRMAIK